MTGRTVEFIGSAGGNPSAALTATSQVNHEGHSGYRIDHLANNLLGNDGTGGNNGGFCFNPAVQPDVILLHIGTNDIWQRYNPGARGKSAEKTFLANLRNRLDSLVNRITVLRPAAHLLVASIIPMNVSSGGTLLNNDVKTYNSYIEKTLVPKYQNLGRQVSFVNQYQNRESQRDDQSHIVARWRAPQPSGYDLMAETWSIAIQSTIGG